MNNDLIYRSQLLSSEVADVINKEDRTVSIGVCSENPVRGGIISCRTEDMDLSFFGSGGAPLLFEHDPSKQIGHVVSADLDEPKGQLRAVVRFSKNSELANEIFSDVADGVRRNISVGFQPLEQIKLRNGDPDGSSRFKTKILEVSVVSIPADQDYRVGVGRNDDISQQQNKEQSSMNDDITQERSESAVAPIDANIETNAPETRADAVHTQHTSADAVRAEQARAADILSIATKHNCVDIGSEAIKRGSSVDQFRAQVLDHVTNKPVAAPNTARSASEQNEYSLWRGIQSAVRHGGEPDGFEGEMSKEMEARSGGRPQGFYVPPGALLKRTTVTTAASGSNADNLIATDHHDEMFIEALRDKSVVIGLGARVFTGLRGNVDIPRQTTTTGIDWIGENAEPTASNPVFDKISMTPHTASQTVALSRRIQQQSEPMINQLIMEDLRMGMARAIDSAVLQGHTTDTASPDGLLQLLEEVEGSDARRWIFAANKTASDAPVTTNLHSSTTVVAQSVDYEQITKLISMLETSNAPMENLAFVCNPRVLHELRNISMQNGGVEGNYIMRPGARDLLGYQVGTSNFVNTHTVNESDSNAGIGDLLYFGNWNEVLVGYWSGLDLRVNPYAQGKKDELQIHAFQDMDCQFRHVESFAAIRGIKA